MLENNCSGPNSRWSCKTWQQSLNFRYFFFCLQIWGFSSKPRWFWQEPLPITTLYCTVTRNKCQLLKLIIRFGFVSESFYQFVYLESNRSTFWLNHIVVLQALSLIDFPHEWLEWESLPFARLKLPSHWEKNEMHQNVSRDLLCVIFLFFVFTSQLCLGSASWTHLTDVSDALEYLSRNVTFMTHWRICDFWGLRDNTVTPDQRHSRSYVSGGPVSCNLVKVTAAKKWKSDLF